MSTRESSTGEVVSAGALVVRCVEGVGWSACSSECGVPGDEGERERDVEGEEAAGIEAASALLMTGQKAAEEQAM